MVINFKYEDAKGEIKLREVLVVHQNKDYIQGFDLKYLNDSERKNVVNNFGSKEITDVKFGGLIDYNKIGVSKETFCKSYRCFKTKSIYN